MHVTALAHTTQAQGQGGAEGGGRGGMGDRGATGAEGQGRGAIEAQWKRAYELTVAYERPSSADGWRELVQTMAAYAVSVAWIVAALPGAAAAFVVLAASVFRAFVLLHDAGHGSLFEGRAANDAAARALSVVCLTGVGVWRRLHAHHHSHFADLDEATRSGQTILFTAAQYRSWPAWRRAVVGGAREAAVFFLAVPALKFGVQYPLLRGDRYTAAGWLLLVWVGARVSLLVPAAVYAAAVAGFMVFHWQHAVNGGYRAGKGSVDSRRAALHGCSCFDGWRGLPRWALCGIGIHAVHHMNPRVPGHRLVECFEEGARRGLWGGVTVLGWREAWRSLSYVMWDEARGRLVSVGDAWPLAQVKA